MASGAGPAAPSSTAGAHKDRRNALINQLYVRQELDECLKLVDTVLDESDGICEFALRTKALIKRQRGEVQESLQLFQRAAALSPNEVGHLKQVAKSLFLLGRHKAAADVYDEVGRMGCPDWETAHHTALCHLHLKRPDKAVESFRLALEIQPHDVTALRLAEVYLAGGDTEAAIQVLGEALQHSPENAELLTRLGVLLLKSRQQDSAYDKLATAVRLDPRAPPTVLAAASIIQEHDEPDLALVKYRTAAVLSPDSPHLWNNIGLAFFAKKKHVAAVTCLKRAQLLGPFEWVVAYNLGLVHLHMDQAASAFNHLSASVSFKPDHALSYMHLGVALARLGDVDSACAAYDRALRLAPQEPLFHLNYAVTLARAGRQDAARAQLARLGQLLAEDVPEVGDRAELDVVAAAAALRAQLGGAQEYEEDEEVDAAGEGSANTG